jgi:hypothetical protein
LETIAEIRNEYTKKTHKPFLLNRIPILIWC